MSYRGIEIMLDRFGFSTFIIEGIPSAGANAVKQQLLSMGSDAAVPHDTINCKKDKVSLIFSIRNDKIDFLLSRFKEQWWGLPELWVRR